MAQQFNVFKKLVRGWKKASRGGKPTFPQEEKQIKEWISAHRQQGYIVTRGTIRMKAK